MRCRAWWQHWAMTPSGTQQGDTIQRLNCSELRLTDSATPGGGSGDSRGYPMTAEIDLCPGKLQLQKNNPTLC